MAQVLKFQKKPVFIDALMEREIREDIRDYLSYYTWEGATVSGRVLIHMFATPRGITIKGNPQWLAIVASEAETCGWTKIPDPQNKRWYAFRRSEARVPSPSIDTNTLGTRSPRPSPSAKTVPTPEDPSIITWDMEDG